MQPITPAWRWDQISDTLTPLELLIRLLNTRNQLLETFLQRVAEKAQGDLGIVGVEEFGNNVGTGSDDTVAFQKALASGYSIAMKPNRTYIWAGNLQFSQAGQELFGGGDSTLVSYVGGGSPLSFNGKSYCKARRFQLRNDGGGTVGIDLPFLSHFWTLDELHISLFSIAGVRAASAYYGDMTHCDIAYNTIGLQGISDFNGNFVRASSFRQNLIGVSIEDTPSAADGSVFSQLEIESAQPGTQYGMQFLGTTSMIVMGTRMELTQGLAHVLVNASATHASQFNQFIGNPLEGIIPAYIIGDGIGSNQVVATLIEDGRAAGSVTINSDCLYTMMRGQPGTYGAGAPIDNGFGSIVMLDPNSGAWYIKPFNSNVAKYKLTVGGAGTIIDVATNTFDIKNTAGTSFRVDPDGRVRAPNGSFSAGGDSGGVAGLLTVPNSVDVSARGAGVGTILFNDGTARNCVGFMKVYKDLTVYQVPLFNHS